MLIPTALIGILIALTMVGAFISHRDTFHPAILLGPILAFHYCYSPLVLLATDGFFGYLTDDQVARAQWVHLAGVAAICLGLVAGSRQRTANPDPSDGTFDSYNQRSLFVGSLVLAALGIASFSSGIANAGGLTKAYGEAYGAGFSDSGWVRDLTLLCLPALLVLSVSRRDRRVTLPILLIGVVTAAPFIIHGFLGARRGPTFMIIAGTVMGIYVARRARPKVITLAVGGALLGVFLLFLVANRQAIYLGSEMHLEADTSAYFRPSAGNDFICGAGLVVITDRTQDFSWGATYLTTLFVRPIPRSIWPNKYEDAAAFFGRPPLTENLGIDVTSFRRELGWTATIGSAPGIVADIWREFSWGMVIVLFGLGASYAYAWRRTADGSLPWMPIYCYMASLSLYLVMQTLEAMLYRFLFGLVPMLWVFHRARRAAGRPSTVDVSTPDRTAPSRVRVAG